MGFGGAVSAMITSLKNNKRNRTSTFDKLERFQKEDNDKLYFKNTASAEDLLKIKLQLKKENKILLIKNCVLIILGLIIIYFLIGFVIF